MDQNITVFAKTNFRNKERVFGIKTKDRRQHMYIIGKTGVGKTTLIENLVLQDIMNGNGVCIVDPHGELVEGIIDRIPKNRIDDVIYFNPDDMDYPVGFNVLEVPDPKYKHLVASDLMGIFTKIWANVWSPRMEYILNNCILALCDTPGTTLMGIQRILVDKDYRQLIIANIKDPVVKSFWIHEYETWRDQFRNEAIVPIQNKVGQFLSTSLIRNIVAQTKSTINIQDIMNNEKILLVNVSKGRVGEDNSALLGAMFITKLQLAAMERVRMTMEKRKDFYLYVDEFQNFVTESFANILSEARKYKLNLIIAHQYIGQLLTSTASYTYGKVKDAIFGNVGTMIAFRVGAPDAEFLEKEFEPEFMAQDIINLPNHHIYLKLMVDGLTCRPFSATTLPPLALSAHGGNKEEIIKSSRQKYSRPRVKVEEEIIRWSSSLPGKEQYQKGDRDGDRFRREKGSEAYLKKPARTFFKFADTLGDLGIEFESHKRPSSLMEAMEPEEPAEEKKSAESYMSLKDLPKPEEKKHEKKSGLEINIEELKHAIKKALGETLEEDKIEEDGEIKD